MRDCGQPTTANELVQAERSWDEAFAWVNELLAWNEGEGRNFHDSGPGEALIFADNAAYALERLASDSQALEQELLELFQKGQSAVRFTLFKPFVAWVAAEPELAKRWFAYLLGGEASLADRVDTCIAVLPEEAKAYTDKKGKTTIAGAPALATLATLFLGAKEEMPVYQPGAAKRLAGRLGLAAAGRGSSPGALVENYAALLDAVVLESWKRELPIRDRFDAYGIVLWLGKGDTWLSQGFGPRTWTEEKRKAFADYCASTEPSVSAELPSFSA